MPALPPLPMPLQGGGVRRSLWLRRRRRCGHPPAPGGDVLHVSAGSREWGPGFGHLPRGEVFFMRGDPWTPPSPTPVRWVWVCLRPPPPTPLMAAGPQAGIHLPGGRGVLPTWSPPTPHPLPLLQQEREEPGGGLQRGRLPPPLPHARPPQPRGGSAGAGAAAAAALLPCRCCTAPSAEEAAVPPPPLSCPAAAALRPAEEEEGCCKGLGFRVSRV